MKRYAGDLSHSSLRKETLQQGLIEETEGGDLKVLKRDYTYATLDPEIIKQMSVSLHEHATTPDHNLDEERKSPARFDGIADNARISSRSAKTFMNLVESRGIDFLNEMDGWLSTHELDEGKSASGPEVRLGVGVYQQDPAVQAFPPLSILDVIVESDSCRSMGSDSIDAHKSTLDQWSLTPLMPVFVMIQAGSLIKAKGTQVSVTPGTPDVVTLTADQIEIEVE